MEEKKFDINSFVGMILLAGVMLYWLNTQKPEEPITPNNEVKTETSKTTSIEKDSLKTKEVVVSKLPQLKRIV